jgi:type 1 glutamine amidotransferase
MPWRIAERVTAGQIAVAVLALCLFGRLSAVAAQSVPPGGLLKVLILTGHGTHDWRSTTPFLRRVLENTGRFDVRVCEVSGGLTARALADFDVLVDHCGESAPGSEAGRAMAHFVESGKGLVITHGALASSAGNQALDGKPQPGAQSATMITGYWPAHPSSSSHAPVHFYDVRLTRPEHPIVRGMPEEFTTADAICHGLNVHGGAEAIAVARDDPQRGGSSKPEPVLLALAYGKGRVFTIALGHDLAAMQERGFLSSFSRGTEWAASGNVTLAANLELPRPDADAVKALLITGGHDHETAFYTLFDGYKDLAWMPVASSATAFQSDLRSKYDVLIMYDFTRDLDDSGKKNLRDFVESGKGVVVLHHALLDYPQWPWWYEDTVGGSYRLRPEGKAPSSTVKDSQQIFVTPEGEHPITSGIGPFHIVDETYKRMRFSSRIRPLLSTDNPNSDRFLAWIGPCTSSRVVAIQLGHGHTAFEHPSYRALVHNVILWSAGRIK